MTRAVMDAADIAKYGTRKGSTRNTFSRECMILSQTYERNNRDTRGVLKDTQSVVEIQCVKKIHILTSAISRGAISDF